MACARPGCQKNKRVSRLSETATFTVTGYEAPAPGEIEALLVAEEIDGAWEPAGRVPFGVGKTMLDRLSRCARARPSRAWLRRPIPERTPYLSRPRPHFRARA
jgi:hypothetical protein